jgi:hypothetical protein
MNKIVFNTLAYEAGIRVDSFNCPVIDNMYQLSTFADKIVAECCKQIDSKGQKYINAIETHFGDTP